MNGTNIVNGNNGNGGSIMRISRAITAAALLALVLAAAPRAFAGGGDKTGTSAADQLLVPVGARGVALGGAYMSGISGVEAIYYNPAGLSGSTSSVDLMFSQATMLGGDGMSYFALGTNFGGFGSLGFTLKSISVDDILITDERQPDGTGAVYSPSFMTLGVTYARALTDRIRAGVTFNLISESFDRVSASGFAFDVGVQYAGLAGIEGLEMGVTLRHIGADMAYGGSGLYRSVDEIGYTRTNQILKIEAATYQMPTSLSIGLAYTRRFEDIHKVLVTGAYENNNFVPEQWRMALEYTYSDFLALRGSYTLSGNDPSDVWGDAASIYGPAFGAGVAQNFGGLRLGVDYAYRAMATWSGSHVFTFNLGF